MAETKSGFSSIEEALAAAENVLGVEDITSLPDGNPGSSTSSVEIDTPTTLEAEPIDGEQPTDDVDADRPQRLADLVKDGEEQPEEDSTVVDFDTVIEVDGEEMTIRELYDRGLRMKDYTQKTQELADQRREMEKAVEVWDMLQEDAVGTIAQLALEAQLIDRSQYEAVMAGRPQTQDRSGLLESQENKVDIDALVAAKVEEVLRQNPQMQKVEREQRSTEILGSLKALESKYALELEDADRAAVLQMAVKEKEPNLEVVLLRMLRTIEVNEEIRDRVKSVSSGKRKSTTPPRETNPKPKNIREAWAMAEAAIN